MSDLRACGLYSRVRELHEAALRDSCRMDPRLWGLLQHHIDSKVIYAKLPFNEFFQMRLVCKEWNQLASNREFLEESFKDPIPRPISSSQGVCSACWLTPPPQGAGLGHHCRLAVGVLLLQACCAALHTCNPDGSS